jgi:uncharacterized protein (DUF1501 family)
MTCMQRRRFLKAIGACGATGLVRLPGVSMAAFGAAFADYKALVSVFLYGGNDSFNMVVPRSNSEYAIYAKARQNLAVAQGDLLPITPDNPDGASYGIHPSMPELKSLFDAGTAAIVANVGPLVVPVTKDAYLARTVPLPPQLFSHNDQQDQWQTLRGTSRLATGWAGRIADALRADTTSQRIALNVSTFGTVIYQAGAHTVPYTIGTEGAVAYGALEGAAAFGAERRAAFERHLAAGFTNVHARALANVHERSLQTADVVNGALAALPSLASVFPTGTLGDQLKLVARLIGVRDALAMSRQIFFVAVGGFDTHDAQNQDQPGLLGQVSRCLAAFQTAMVELGVETNVVAFTQSDFGRTLTSNGDGTDHGWGGHQLVVSGAANGRRIYGTMPRLEIGGPDDATGGRIIPTMSADQFAATLARWFGVAPADLITVAPSLANFPASDLGFV